MIIIINLTLLMLRFSSHFCDQSCRVSSAMIKIRVCLVLGLRLGSVLGLWLVFVIFSSTNSADPHGRTSAFYPWPNTLTLFPKAWPTIYPAAVVYHNDRSRPQNPLLPCCLTFPMFSAPCGYPFWLHTQIFNHKNFINNLQLFYEAYPSYYSQ